MPRPGPRPYECIRRAWHSDSHQALRGSLTQEIFRIVTEIHSPETRSKKEWQEKLPIVVLRAEEILYSKARTEMEYTDVSTLKSRLQDAVNTMIRRTDDNKEEESGAFMEPCVEAALSLGCIPKMNPRGQRNCPARFSGNNVRRSSNNQPSNPGVVQAQQSAHDNLPFLGTGREWTVPGQLLVEPMRAKVPRYLNGNVTTSFEQQQQQQQQRQLSAQLPFNFQLKEQSFGTSTSSVFSEEYNYHPSAAAAGAARVGDLRFQHQNRMLPKMFSEPARNANHRNKQGSQTDHDLELSLGLPRAGVHVEVSGSSSSSGSSMSWQSEGGQDCPKRKAVACTFSGAPQNEVTKRQRDYPFY